jgi:hypothetical protein
MNCSRRLRMSRRPACWRSNTGGWLNRAPQRKAGRRRPACASDDSIRIFAPCPPIEPPHVGTVAAGGRHGSPANRCHPRSGVPGMRGARRAGGAMALGLAVLTRRAATGVPAIYVNDNFGPAMAVGLSVDGCALYGANLVRKQRGPARRGASRPQEDWAADGRVCVHDPGTTRLRSAPDAVGFGARRPAPCPPTPLAGGIDRPVTKAVIHYGLPASLDVYSPERSLWNGFASAH